MIANTKLMIYINYFKFDRMSQAKFRGDMTKAAGLA